MHLMMVTFEVFHLDISGIDFKDVQLLNKEFIFVIFEVFHFDISGNESKDKQLQNIEFISITLLIFHIPFCYIRQRNQ